jgi:hypothetical protein
MVTWTEFVPFMIDESGEMLWISNIPAEFVQEDSLFQ